MFKSTLIIIISGIAVSFATYWLQSRGQKSPPKEITEGSGVLTPGKTSAWITVIFGFGFGFAGIVALLLGEGWTVGLIGIIVGGCIGGFMLPSLYSCHDIIWTPEYVEGASHMFGPTLGSKRRQIKWNDIISTGITSTQYWYIETADKRRIYWSYLYNGYGYFHEELKRHCPELEGF